MYNYTGAGLKNVYLQNGYRTLTYGGEEVVSVEDVEGLHRAIARSLIEKPSVLTGEEIRFLRIEMDLSQVVLGQLLGSSYQNIANWEKGRHSIPGPADRLIRLCAYACLLEGESEFSKLIELLATLDNQAVEEMYFLETEDGWKKSA